MIAAVIVISVLVIIMSNIGRGFQISRKIMHEIEIIIIMTVFRLTAKWLIYFSLLRRIIYHGPLLFATICLGFPFPSSSCTWKLLPFFPGVPWLLYSPCPDICGNPFTSGSQTPICYVLHSFVLHLAFAVSVLQFLKSGTLSLRLFECEPAVILSAINSRPTTSSWPSNPLFNAPSLAPQIRLWLTIVRVHKLYLLTYL